MINDVSSNGENALMHGILSGSLETVVVLLEAGADLSATGNRGLTAFHHAANRDHPDILEVLAVHPDGEQVIDLKDKYGRSPLDLAQVRMNCIMVVILHVSHYSYCCSLSLISMCLLTWRLLYACYMLLPVCPPRPLVQSQDHKHAMDVLLMYGAAMTKKGSIRMSKEVRRARNDFLREREEERIAALEEPKTISLS